MNNYGAAQEKDRLAAVLRGDMMLQLYFRATVGIGDAAAG